MEKDRAPLPISPQLVTPESNGMAEVDNRVPELHCDGLPGCGERYALYSHSDCVVGVHAGRRSNARQESPGAVLQLAGERLCNQVLGNGGIVRVLR